MPSTLRLWFALAISLAAWPARAQGPEIPSDALIRLQRTSCYGPCPIYTVTIDAGGTVTYEGEGSVRVLGRQTAKIDTSIVAELLARAERIRFFEMRDAYRVIENPDGTVTLVTDLATKFVTVTVNGRTTKVEAYVAAPDSLADFERLTAPPVRSFELDGRPSGESGGEPERAADRQGDGPNALDEHLLQGCRRG